MIVLAATLRAVEHVVTDKRLKCTTVSESGCDFDLQTSKCTGSDKIQYGMGFWHY